MAKPSWWPYCWDAWRKSRWTVGFSSFFFVGGGVGLTEKASQFFLLKEKIISNFYFQKYSTGFTWVIFWSPKKNGPKRAFIHLIEGLELVQRFLLFAGGQVDLFKMIRKLMCSRWFKMIQDAFFPSFCAVVILAVVVIFEFWGGVQLSQPAVKVGVEEVYIQLSTFK